MPPKAPQPFEFDSSELEDIDKMLHLTMHRNKNQHRLAKWWKSFQMLRRNIAKLLAELAECTRTQTKKSRAAVEDRVDFILEVLVPKCYRSFGAVIADNQYAALGLMLMGTLARLNKIITPIQRKAEVVVPAVAQKQASTIEDIGELVARETQEKAEPDLISNGQPKPGQKEPEKKPRKADRPSSNSTDKTSSKPPKKKRKKGNAIDDLFSGII